MISQLVAALIVALVTFIPGILASFALLHGVKLSRLEKILFGLVLGAILAPVLSAAEFTFLGFGYSAALFVANSAVIALVSLAVLYKQKQLESLPALALPKIGSAGAEITPARVESWVKNNWVACLLVVLLLTGFYVRFATAWSTNFFEFDPYYYDKVTERLVQNGAIPLFTSESYYPEQAFMRWAPIMHYLTGGWYMLYQNILGGPYSKDSLILVAQLYAPFVGALLSFLAFLIIREEYNEYIALIPAALFAFTPQLLKKLSAGVNEQQPWGIFAAILLFTVFLLAVNRKSYRLAVLAALAAAANILGSQQYIWPFLVIGAYVAIQALLDFLAGETDERLLKINAIVAGGALAANALMYLFQEASYTPLPQNSVLIWVAAFLFSAALYALTKFVSLSSFKERAAWACAVTLVCAIAVAFTPIGANALSYASATTTYAQAGSALGKTIQEEGVTSNEMFVSSFGFFAGAFEPSNVLKFAALLSALSAVMALWSKKMKRGAIALAAVVFALTVLNAQVDGVLQWLAAGTGSEAVANAVSFFVNNDVFLYMLIALFATSVSYLASEKKNRSALLFMLVFFPVAYIGLNKLKYMLHLAVALCIAAGYIFGEALRAFESSADLFAITDKKTIYTYALAGLFLIGVVVVALQARTVDNSMTELGFTRMTDDWVQAYKWMAENTPKDSRVMSWWDYGHWTTFFGERDTVLDPNNAYAEFDQGVARSFVNGNWKDLYSRMEFHKATHVLVDADLVGKWGALVFLSGTCNSNQSPVCPETPEIDWRAGPGSSKYEAEHYYEYLTVVGKCPLTASPVQLDALQSGYGAVYCAGQQDLFLLKSDGTLDENYKRKYKIAGRDEITELSSDTSYLFAIAQSQFINVNPDLSYANLNNNVFNSAFTHFFFFENAPGFKLVYASPKGQVKIFEYVGEPVLLENQQSSFLNPEALATPTPTSAPEAATTAPIESPEIPTAEASAAPSTTPSTAPTASPEASPATASPAASIAAASPAASLVV